MTDRVNIGREIVNFIESERVSDRERMREEKIVSWRERETEREREKVTESE